MPTNPTSPFNTARRRFCCRSIVHSPFNKAVVAKTQEEGHNTFCKAFLLRLCENLLFAEQPAKAVYFVVGAAFFGDGVIKISGV